MTSMITLIIWTITGIITAICQLKINRIPPYMFWLTYLALMLNLGANALTNAY